MLINREMTKKEFLCKCPKMKILHKIPLNVLICDQKNHHKISIKLGKQKI